DDVQFSTAAAVAAGKKFVPPALGLAAREIFPRFARRHAGLRHRAVTARKSRALLRGLRTSTKTPKTENKRLKAYFSYFRGFVADHRRSTCVSASSTMRTAVSA